MRPIKLRMIPAHWALVGPYLNWIVWSPGGTLISMRPIRVWSMTVGTPSMVAFQFGQWRTLKCSIPPDGEDNGEDNGEETRTDAEVLA